MNTEGNGVIFVRMRDWLLEWVNLLPDSIEKDRKSLELHRTLRKRYRKTNHMVPVQDLRYRGNWKESTNER